MTQFVQFGRGLPDHSHEECQCTVYVRSPLPWHTCTASRIKVASQEGSLSACWRAIHDCTIWFRLCNCGTVVNSTSCFLRSFCTATSTTSLCQTALDAVTSWICFCAGIICIAHCCTAHQSSSPVESRDSHRINAADLDSTTSSSYWDCKIWTNNRLCTNLTCDC